ncbi:hypothetical protein [Mycobacterium branderi]|nr:hypothetical protein [Mycobacterium branderi]MCV7235280.1 hypothetical protein [Mycobacterium branderi]
MPARLYSSQILSELWPQTDPDTWSELAQHLRDQSRQLENEAAEIRSSRDDLPPHGAVQGTAADAACRRQAQIMLDQSVQYRSMADTADEVAHLISHTCARLDDIDRAANEQIELLYAANAGCGLRALGASILMDLITGIVARARARANTVASCTAAKIMRHAQRIATMQDGM